MLQKPFTTANVMGMLKLELVLQPPMSHILLALQQMESVQRSPFFSSTISKMRRAALESERFSNSLTDNHRKLPDG